MFTREFSLLLTRRVDLKMQVFIDVQCFKQMYDELVIKELSSVSFNQKSINQEEGEEEEITNLLFEPPCEWYKLSKPYQLMNSWTTRHLHGIPWEAGTISYQKLREKLNKIIKNKQCIYVKGLEKKQWLELMLGNKITIYDLKNLGCPSVRQLKSMYNIEPKCNFNELHKDIHDNFHNCSLENVHRLKMWYINVYCNIKPSLKRSLDIYIDLKENIKEMTVEDISFLSKKFLLKFASNSIKDIWNKLSDEMKKDEDIKECRRCRIHHNIIARDYDFYDGPIPMIKYCLKCKLGNIK